MKSNNRASTRELAHNFVEKLSPDNERATIIGLQGDLGSGKTTFVQAMAEALGITGVVTSPTFVIEKIYKTTHSKFQHLIHIDAYRLESGAELEVLGWRDIVSDPHNLIAVEWPERIGDILPSHTPTINFTFINETTREIVFPHA